jgi:hypothetical protein
MSKFGSCFSAGNARKELDGGSNPTRDACVVRVKPLAELEIIFRFTFDF